MSKTIDNLNQQELTDLHSLLRRAELGDQTALADLKQALDNYPEISSRYGDLGIQAIEAWLKLIAGPNLLLYEATKRKLEEMRAELSGGSDAPLLERLLVEQILTCWIQARHVDAVIAQGNSPMTSNQLNQRQTGAHHRFLKSVQALATLRKLLRVVPSPVQIASRLSSQCKQQMNRRSVALAAGIGAAIDN